MLELIIGFAQERDDIRAAILTGSRANPTTARDPLQDYDVTYLVKNLTPYRQNKQIPQYFGEIMILQTPDGMGDAPSPNTSYAFLMQFMDGNRIDITFRIVDEVAPILADSLSLVLLDKDRQFTLPPPTLSSYLPKKPTAKQFADCCNEFWWLNPYVAKGLYRDQIIYAKAIFDGPMREQLMAMLTWSVGVTTDFGVSLGHLAKHLKTQIASDVWDLVERTYSDTKPDHVWQALFVTQELFRKVALPVAQAFGFPYPNHEDALVSSFVRQIRESTANMP